MHLNDLDFELNPIEVAVDVTLIGFEGCCFNFVASTIGCNHPAVITAVSQEFHFFNKAVTAAEHGVLNKSLYIFHFLHSIDKYFTLNDLGTIGNFGK